MSDLPSHNNYVVHHIDGDLSNNELENLLIVKREEHGMSRAIREESEVERTIRKAAAYTRKADTLSRAKDLVDEIYQDFPPEAKGSAWLEEAIELIGRAESEIDDATERLVEEGLGES